MVRFHAGGMLEMSWDLFTWGNQVEIIKPRRLVAMLHKQIAQLHHSDRLEDFSDNQKNPERTDTRKFRGAAEQREDQA
jgi:hypothetical protein